LIEQEKYTRARAAFEAARRIDSKLPGVWVGLARIDRRTGRFAAAQVNLKRAIALAPHDTTSLNFAAWLYATAPTAAARDGRKAVAHALRACELTAWSSFSYLDTLAAAYAELGDFAKAVDFQWFALSLLDDDDESRGEAEERLKLYQRKRKYREVKEPDTRGRAKPPTPTEAPTPPLWQSPGGPVGMSSPLLQQREDPAGCWRALPRSCA
jgi:tetratricopeptide (TPR) repeat protein